MFWLCTVNLEYYYDLDFTDDCAGHEEIQERNDILYKNYCFLVSSCIYTYNHVCLCVLWQGRMALADLLQFCCSFLHTCLEIFDNRLTTAFLLLLRLFYFWPAILWHSYTLVP